MLNILGFYKIYTFVPIFVCISIIHLAHYHTTTLTLSENGYQFGNQTWRVEKC